MEVDNIGNLFSDGQQELAQLLDGIWSNLTSCHPVDDLHRVRDYLDVMLGIRAPEPNSNIRAVFRRLYFPGLSTGPFYEPAYLGLDVGDETVAAICHECERGFSVGHMTQNHSDLTADGGNWFCVYLKRDFNWIESNAELFPSTSRFLQGHRVATEALFSRLLPGTKIEPHSDHANYVTTVHVPLRATRSKLTVGGVGKRYEYGVPLCFDSTFFHEVYCDGDGPRDVLLFNVWHPDLTETEIWAIQTIRNLWSLSRAFDPDLGVLDE